MNGDNSAPLYKFLKLGKWGIFGDDIQWNFSKFVVDKNGQVVGRYYPTTSPLSLEVKTILSMKLLHMLYAASINVSNSFGILFLLYCSETSIASGNFLKAKR